MNPKRDAEFRLKLARRAEDTARRIIEQWPQKGKN